MPKNETSAYTPKYSKSGTPIKSKLQRIAAGTGVLMILSTAAIADDDNFLGVIAHIAIAVALLAYGRAFDFQNRNNR
ncbi:MAG: hypothetical protein J1E33_06305 [Alistipes sp.]|nr:hypothetical protein [Alistipes sp.]